MPAGCALIESSPIVNLHIVYDRPVCEHRFAAGVDTPVQYLFDRTAAGGVPPGCQYLAVSLSGAEREMRMSVDELRERYLPALSALLPRARGPRGELLRHPRARRHVSRHPRDRTPASPRPHLHAGTRSGRRLDRYRLARHARGRGDQRAHGCERSALAEPELEPAEDPRRRRRRGREGVATRRVRVAAPLALEEALIRSAARGVRVRKTGMGPERSLAAVARLRAEPAHGLMVLGFCGGLDEHSRPGK